MGTGRPGCGPGGLPSAPRSCTGPLRRELPDREKPVKAVYVLRLLRRQALQCVVVAGSNGR